MVTGERAREELSDIYQYFASSARVYPLSYFVTDTLTVLTSLMRAGVTRSMTLMLPLHVTTGQYHLLLVSSWNYN